MDLSIIQDPPKPFSRGPIKTPHWGEVAPRDRKHRGKWELGAKGQGGLLFSSAFVPPPPHLLQKYRLPRRVQAPGQGDIMGLSSIEWNLGLKIELLNSGE